MLIEFKAKNYRSIREEQTFSLVAGNADRDLKSCVIERDLPGMAGIRYLRGAAIYGANASGKSNIIAAIRFLGDFVQESAVKIGPGEMTGTVPFKLDQKSVGLPSEFEITFVAEEVRYLYQVGLTSERIIYEYLTAYPKGIPQKWFRRDFDEDLQSYKWAKSSTYFKHDKDLQAKTRQNSLFLSVGPQFNHPQLTVVYNWFRNNLRFLELSAESSLPPIHTAALASGTENRASILNLLKSADIGIADLTIKQKTLSLESLKNHLPPPLLEQLDLKEKGEFTTFEISLGHQAETEGKIVLDFDTEESAGTRRFFSLIGPWTEILKNGYTVFIDEIETSLHPILVRELLELLFCGKDAPVDAQIVFTTHNAFLLDTSLMRRDMIWFTEKTSSGATRLYPLTDYAPRKDEALAKGYLAGRYGAIPYLPDGLKL